MACQDRDKYLCISLIRYTVFCSAAALAGTLDPILAKDIDPVFHQSQATGSPSIQRLNKIPGRHAGGESSTR
jgi:hypothetical protein